MSKGINWLGVVVATVLVIGIGILWYGVVFQAKWVELSAPTADEIARSTRPFAMAAGSLNSLIMVLALDWLVRITGSTTWMKGIKTGLFAGLFFAATTAALGFIYAGHTPELIPIDIGYLLVIYFVAGAVLGGVRLQSKAA
jgi:hypothetical protein